MRAGQAAARLCYTYIIEVLCESDTGSNFLLACCGRLRKCQLKVSSFQIWKKKKKKNGAKAGVKSFCCASPWLSLTPVRWEAEWLKVIPNPTRESVLTHIHTQTDSHSYCICPVCQITPAFLLSLWSTPLAVNSSALLCSFPFRLVGLTSRCSSG